MNSDIQDLPTKSDVIRFLGRQRHSIAAVFDANGEQVVLGGRQVGEATERKVGGPVHCAICDAPAGEVTLMRVDQHSELAAKLRDELGTSAVYICYAGDCSGQRNKALMRPFIRATRAISTRRFTKNGHAMQWVADSEGKVTLEYARTSQSAKRIKARRKARKVGHRANRSK